MDWMEELNKALKRPFGGDDDGDDDDYEGADDGEGDDGDEDTDEDETPKRMAKKCAKKSVTDPKPNAETTTGDKAAVHDPKSLDRRTGGGPAGPLNKSVGDELSDEAKDALEVSSVLGELTKGIDSLAAVNAANTTEQIGALAARLETLEKGLATIGKALTVSLNEQSKLTKSLAADVEQIGRQPAGRKSQVRKIEKGFAGPSGAEMPSRTEIMEKSLAAVKAGKIDPHTVSGMEAAYNRGEWWHPSVQAAWERINKG